MKAVEFAFWLQGYFELTGGADPLTATQAQKIAQKAATVKAGTGEAEAKANDYVAFAQGVLLMAGQTADGAALGFATQTLKSRLNDLFLHAIDPTMQGDQQQLRRTHRPEGGGGLVAMC